MKNVIQIVVVVLGIWTLPLLSSVNAQSYDYADKWRKIDSLNTYGLPKSAMEVLQEVYEIAKSENNTVNYLRVMLYKTKKVNYYDNESYTVFLKELLQEEKESVFPTKQFLNFLIGEMFWKYYQNNSYKILKRTKVVNYNLDDIKTWDARTIVEEAIKYYYNSVLEPDRLQLINIENFNDILNNYAYDKVIPNGRKYRPTLYDFLAFNAIDFFSNKEAELTRPAEQFLMNDSAYTAEAKEFSELNISTKDLYSFEFYAITILKDVIKFHIKDGNTEALVDADLKRLKFVYNNSGSSEKETLYVKALQQMLDIYSENPVSTLISYDIAKVYKSRGNKYKPEIADVFKDDLRTAYTICKNASEKFPESDGTQYCQSIMASLETKNLEIKTEAYNIPDKPFRTLTKYRNVNKLYYKIVKTNHEEIKSLETEYFDLKSKRDFNETLIGKFRDKNSIYNFEVELPNDGDFQEHSAEVKIPALSAGFYLMLAGTDKNFSYNKNTVVYSILQINSISYINKTNDKGENEFYILDRETGYPIEDAEVTLNIPNIYALYNDRREIGKYYSDKNGYFLVKNINERREFNLDISYNGQFLTTRNYDFGFGYLREEFNEYASYRGERKAYKETYFFTDRSLYRPGQMMYFKGIVIESKGKEDNIVTGKNITVELLDVNGKLVSQQDLITNEFGTINGSFTLPNAGLNGKMKIRVQNGAEGSASFSVEDYKRPKFEVKYEPVKGSYKLGDNVSVKGFAKSYSGANLDNANVKYKVVRYPSYPSWYVYWFERYFQAFNSGYTVIMNGNTNTNINGEFEVNFSALPDESISKKLRPYYNYSIESDVTDINGETHSNSTSVSVGYNSLIPGLEIGSNVDKNDNKYFRMFTTNLNGEREPAKVNVTIFKLKSPDRAFRKRLWSKPDKYTMTKDEYYKNFPYDEYGDESDYTKWEKESKIFDRSYNTEFDSVLVLDDLQEWNQGKYYAEMSAKDKDGEEVKELYYFTVYSKSENNMPFTSFENYICKGNNYEAGGNVEFILGTSMKDTRVLLDIDGNDDTIKREWITISNGQKKFEIPVKESSEGGFAYNLTFVKAGRIVSHTEFISVPFTSKMLDINIETFRDKLKPGDKEEWKIKLKGKNGEKVTAEMVATLYDASLDAIKNHIWSFDAGIDYYSRYSNRDWSSNINFNTYKAEEYSNQWNKESNFKSKNYDKLNRFLNQRYIEDFEKVDRQNEIIIEAERKGIDVEQSGRIVNDRNGINIRGGRSNESVIIVDGIETTNPLDQVKKAEIENIVARKDFRETVFFKPDLRTDDNGELTISFEMPDALTKWKLIGFAHTKDLKRGMITREFITQKELMVTPNVPRYFREDDKVVVSAKITNLSDKDLTGDAALLLSDGTTMKSVDVQFKNKESMKKFEVKKNSSTMVNWEVAVPYGFETIGYKIVAKAGNFSDGEEAMLPVLSNRMLVTETMPMSIRGNETKTFSMNRLLNNNSGSLTNYKLSLEFTSNPAWYALQSLPYLMEFPHECAEQVFSRLYANSIATHIVNSNPKIKETFEKWNTVNPDALLSNLEKNEELKGLLLQETPWVMEAKNDSERKRRISNLFELNRMSSELDKAVKKLKKMQYGSGAWPWFEGMSEDRYITQHIAAGLGKLYKLGIRKQEDDKEMIIDAVNYLDQQIRNDYEELVRLANKREINLNANNLGSMQIHYLYARSFFGNKVVELKNKEAMEYFKGQAAKYWTNRGIYTEGMIALALKRFGDDNTAEGIVKSLKEKSIYSEDMGMYWENNTGGYYWYEAPIETQALMIEVFDEVGKDEKSVDDMKVWLLKNKQTNDWKTTKATVEAVYALLLKGDDWLSTDMLVDINVGTQKIDMSGAEAGTGYFKTNWQWGDVKTEMGKITVTRKSATGISWGALYWQYFEDLDKIAKQETNLKVEKKLFVVENTQEGEVIKPIDGKLKVGDRVRVRIELRSDRDMEYVHMKDMRAAGFEPMNVLSGYKYQDGLGYYESTRDAATNFFFSYLRKGTYVFEYDLRVNLSGDYSNGITTVQCMYAPEFASHSEGVRVVIGN